MNGNNKMPKELMTLVTELASKIAIECYAEEEKKAERRRKNEKINKVKDLLKAYRRTIAKLEDEKEFTDEEKAEYRWKFVEDLMGSAKEIVSKSQRIIEDSEKKRQEDMYAIYRLENAMKLYKKECEISFCEEEKRRYRIVFAMYMDKEVKSVQEIAEAENVSEKTVYRDLGIAYQILAIYLYGI